MTKLEILTEISFIDNVDFVPRPKKEYQKWNQPYRAMAIKALRNRKQNWKKLVEQKLNSYA